MGQRIAMKGTSNEKQKQKPSPVADDCTSERVGAEVELPQKNFKRQRLNRSRSSSPMALGGTGTRTHRKPLNNGS